MSIENYFQFLNDCDYNKIDFQGKKDIIRFFWDLLKWNRIFDEIEISILNNYHKKN